MTKGGTDVAEIIREPVAYHRLRLVPGVRHSRRPLAGIFEFIRLNPIESECSIFFLGPTSRFYGKSGDCTGWGLIFYL